MISILLYFLLKNVYKPFHIFILFILFLLFLLFLYYQIPIQYLLYPRLLVISHLFMYDVSNKTNHQFCFYFYFPRVERNMDVTKLPLLLFYQLNHRLAFLKEDQLRLYLLNVNFHW